MSSAIAVPLYSEAESQEISRLKWESGCDPDNSQETNGIVGSSKAKGALSISCF